MTARRTLGSGPQGSARSIWASPSDLADALPGVRIADLDELRARGVLGARTTTPSATRRALGAGGRSGGDSPSADST